MLPRQQRSGGSNKQWSSSSSVDSTMVGMGGLAAYAAGSYIEAIILHSNGGDHDDAAPFPSNHHANARRVTPRVLAGGPVASGCGYVDAFTSRVLPDVSPRDYLSWLAQGLRLDDVTVYGAVALLKKALRGCGATEHHHVHSDGAPCPAVPAVQRMTITPYNVHRLVLASTALAYKATRDLYPSLSEFASVGGISTSEMASLELILFAFVGYDAVTRDDELDRCRRQVLRSAATAAPPSSAASSSRSNPRYRATVPPHATSSLNGGGQRPVFSTTTTWGICGGGTTSTAAPPLQSIFSASPPLSASFLQRQIRDPQPELQQQQREGHHHAEREEDDDTRWLRGSHIVVGQPPSATSLDHRNNAVIRRAAIDVARAAAAFTASSCAPITVDSDDAAIAPPSADNDADRCGRNVEPADILAETPRGEDPERGVSPVLRLLQCSAAAGGS